MLSRFSSHAWSRSYGPRLSSFGRGSEQRWRTTNDGVIRPHLEKSEHTPRPTWSGKNNSTRPTVAAVKQKQINKSMMSGWRCICAWISSPRPNSSYEKAHVAASHMEGFMPVTQSTQGWLVRVHQRCLPEGMTHEPGNGSGTSHTRHTWLHRRIQSSTKCNSRISTLLCAASTSVDRRLAKAIFCTVLCRLCARRRGGGGSGGREIGGGVRHHFYAHEHASSRFLGTVVSPCLCCALLPSSLALACRRGSVITVSLSTIRRQQ